MTAKCFSFVELARFSDVILIFFTTGVISKLQKFQTIRTLSRQQN